MNLNNHNRIKKISKILQIILLVTVLSVFAFPAYGCQPSTITTEPPTTTTEPPTTTTTAEGPGKISYDYHYIYTDASYCFICHTGDAPLLAQPEGHVVGRANDSCLDDGCHELSEQQ
jgi:hypothetical protein